MKKITPLLIATALTATSFNASAAIPTGASPFQITVPNLVSGVEFTLEGLYLQPTSSDLTYASNTTGTSPNFTTNTTSITPNYDFGFTLGLGHIFKDSGNDVQASWTHFNHDTSDSVSANSGIVQNILGGGTVSLNSGGTANSSSQVSYQYDAADVDMGQYLSIGTRLQTRLFAGLRYVNLRNNVTDTYTYSGASIAPGDSDAFVPVEDNSITTVSFDSTFSGIGPRVGIDTSYHVAKCFGVVAHFATALLVGRVTSSTTDDYPHSLILSIENTPEQYSTSNQTRVVPEIDGKLGLNYTIGFKNGTSGMTIETGYSVTQYIDAIDRIYGAGSVTTSSVGFSGPYLSLNFKV